MNKAYKSVWNEVTGTWVAVQENATGRGKRSSARAAKVLNAAVILGAGSLAASAAHADSTCEPGGYSATSGDGGTSSAGCNTAATDSGTPALIAPMVMAASSNGSGVDTDGMAKTYITAAYYSQVSGLVNGSGSVPPSDMARANGAGSIAIGSNTLVTGTAGTAVGIQAYTSAKDAVALGSGSVANEDNTVSVGNDGTSSYRAMDPKGDTYTIQNQANTRRIVNMAAGQNDTDAVNVSQIKVVTTALGGGASLNADGSIQAPTYVFDGGTYGDVGSALQAIDDASHAGLAEAVTYDSSSHDTVTLGGADTGHAPVQLSNVANAKENNDAINLAQLKAAGLTVDTSGNVTNSFIAYDNLAKTAATLGGAGSKTPVALHNVAAAALNASSHDAVNGSQLFATNQKLDETTGNVTNIQTQLEDVLKYDSSAHDTVTLGGTDAPSPVALRNVSAGISSNDAANVGQLTSAGFQLDGSGAVLNKAVTFDNGSIAAGTPTITLDPGSGDSVYFRNGNRKDGLLPAGTRISNVANGTQDTDAANVGQVYDIMNLSQGSGPMLMSAKLLAASSNGSGVNTGGLNTVYKTAAYYSQVAGLGDSSGSTPPSDMARATGNGSIAIGSNTFTTGTGGTAVGVQAYTPANDAVALGSGSVANEVNTVSVGNDGTTSFVAYDAQGRSYTIQNAANTRRIVNMSAGENDTDAVNVSQLKDVTTALGGGAGVNPDGSIEAPSYVVEGGTYGDVGSALQAVDEAARAGSANAVKYDSSAHDKVTLGGTGADPVQLSNVANAKQGNDAVNLSQLEAAGLSVDTSGNVTNSFVAYDDSNKDSVTFGGKGSNRPVALHNVAAGVVSASSYDAVNGSQLYGLAASTATALGGGTTANPDGTLGAPSYVVDTNTYHNVGSALDAVVELAKGGSVDAVIYDSSAHNKLTLGGTGHGPVQLTNVANATNASDAVNLSQLQAAGLDVDTSGNVTNSFVTYDDSNKDSVTFGGTGSKTPVVLHNVAAGAQGTDAVNVSQLEAAGLIIDSSGNVTNAFVAYDDSTKTSVTLGGTSPSGTVALHNVANATSSNDAVNLAQLQAAGLDVDSSGNVTNSFVAYDDSNKTSVTFGGTGTTTPVVLHNVANATSSTDAVNLAQLQAAGLDVDSSGNVTNAFVAYDDATKSSVTFGGTDSTTPVALHNVANATSSTDAVNLAQLQAAGLDVDSSGNVTNAFVAYDDATKSSVTFGGTDSTTPVVLHNVANATSSTDAVNLAQLQAAGLDVDSSGNVTNAFVAYDDATKSSVTFGGTGSTTPVVLHNVAAGAQGTDAVNVSQLEAAGLIIDSSGNVTNAFVAYDDATKSSVTLGGTDSTTPVALHNVANATSTNDAVNLAQLLAAGLSVDTSGNVTNAFVAYDNASKAQITLGGAGGTVITNLKDGLVADTSTDAVNGSQLYALEQKMNASGLGLVVQNGEQTITVGADTNGNLVDFTGTSGARRLTGVGGGSVDATSSDAVNGAQLYATAESTASALGGGSTVNPDGTLSAPTYVVGGTTVNNVGDALTNIDGRLTNIAGSVANAVQYDSTAHDQVTLGGTDATSTVKLTNLTDAELSATSTDAVTGAQLYATNEQLANLGKSIENIDNTGSQYLSTNSDSGPASATGTSSIAGGGGAIASGANSTAIGDRAAAQADNSVALGANSVADRANSVSVGSAGNERQITNVADGQAPTDAVNMRQFQGSMTSVQRGAYGGVAAATALTMIPDVDQGKTIAVGIGTANYKGYQATALGASARITQNLKVKVGAGYSAGGGTTVGGGMSYQW